MPNKNLTNAKNKSNNEYYTRLVDIEKELFHYKGHFKDKVLYCNCDDPRESNFFLYFSQKFEELGLKKLIATCYKSTASDLFSKHKEERAVYQIYEGLGGKNKYNPDDEDIVVKELEGDGDFRSAECIELLKESDIVVTNPPFSLFRQYIGQLIEYKKKFLIIGNINAISYKEVYPFIKAEQIWIGCSGRVNKFIGSDDKEKATSSCWYTNLEHNKSPEELDLSNTYYGNEAMYPRYDNYDAIECARSENIPYDYKGVIGVPITYLLKHNPEQFELLGLAKDEGYDDAKRTKEYGKLVGFSKKGKELKDRVKIEVAPVLYSKTKPINKTYYIAEDRPGYYITKYARLLIRNKQYD